MLQIQHISAKGFGVIVSDGHKKWPCSVAVVAVAVIECVLFQNLTNLGRSERYAPRVRVLNQNLISSAPTHLRESDLATPHVCCWASAFCLVVKEGVVCGALHRREQDDHTHYDQTDLCILLHRTGSISSDKSRSIQINLDRCKFVRF